MHRLNVSLLCLLSLSLAGSASAQSATISPSAPSGVTTYDGYSGGATLGTGTYFNIRHMTGPGVGYSSSYSQIGGFMPAWIGDNTFIAPDVRMMVTNNSKIGGNGGLVARHYLESADRIIGGYGYYDVDQSQANFNYRQTTFGLETMGTWWDLRSNAYIPSGLQDNAVPGGGVPICVSGNPFFQGNNIVFTGVKGQTREQAMGGGDIEFGMPVSAATPWLRAYAGAYYYNARQQAAVPVDDPIPGHKSNNPVGFRGRIDAWISDDLLAGVNVTTDPVWGTNVNAMIDFRFSGFRPTRYFPQWTTRERMLQPVQRNWRIATEQYGTAVNAQIVATNPAGNPYLVSFIDNTNVASGPGNGTFADPFTSFNHPGGIPGADLIIVEKGTSTYLAPYQGTMVLNPNQVLLGEGAQSTTNFNFAATFGNCSVASNTLPVFGTAGHYPFVQSTPGSSTPVIVLSNNNEVAGFNIVNSAGSSGIQGTGITNFNLHDLNITGNHGVGINLVGVTGTTTIIQNINQGTVDYNNTSSPTLMSNGPGNNAGGGIFVSSGPGGIGNLQLTNVTMSSTPPFTPPAGKQPFGVSLLADGTTGGGPFGANLTNVTTNGNVNGVVLTANSQTLTTTMASVTASGGSGDGVQVNTNAGTNTVNATNPAAPLISTSNMNGLTLNGSNGGVTNVNIVGGILNSNTQDGIHSNQSSGATLNLNVDPTQISFNGRDGFFSNGNTGAIVNANFQTDTIFQNQINGVAFTSIGSQFNLLSAGTTINGSKFGSGIAGQATGGSVLLNFSGNSSISGNATDGVAVAMNGTTFAGVFADTAINGNTGGNGFHLTMDNSNATLSLAGATTVNANGANGILVDGAAPGGATFTSFTPILVGTSILRNGNDGVQFNVGQGSTVGTAANSGMFQNVTIADNGRDGVFVNVGGVVGSPTGSYLVSNNTRITNLATTNQKVGFQFSVNGGGQLTSIFTDGSLASNNTNALNGTVTGTGSVATVQLVGTNASGSGMDNGNLTVNPGGTLNFSTAGDAANPLVNMSGSTGGAGLVVNVNPADSVAGLVTTAKLDLDSVSMNANHTYGFIANVTDTVNAPTAAQLAAFTSNTTLNVCLEGSSFSNNGMQGLNLMVTGQGATASYGAGAPDVNGAILAGSPIAVNSNGMEGVLAQVSNLGTVNFRSMGSTFDGNGKTGTFNGLYFGANNGTVRTLFYSGSAGSLGLGNTGDGLGYGGIGGEGLVTPAGVNTNLSNFSVSLQNGFSSSYNTGYGLNFNAKGANSAYLIQDPSNPVQLTNNTKGAESFDFSSANQVLLQLLGAQPSGVNLSFTGNTTAIVSINGLGTSIDNTAGNGINLNFNDVTNAAVTISGFKSISGNTGGSGVNIVMDGVTKQTNGAIEVDGVAGGTTMANNANSGVNIALTNTNLVNPITSLPGVNLAVLTNLSNNTLDSCVPAPITLAAGNGVLPSAALNINNLNISGGSKGGIVVAGVNSALNVSDSNLLANQSLIQNNTVNGTGGAGIAVLMNVTPPYLTATPPVTTVNDLLITGNYVGAVGPGPYNVAPTATANIGDGIQVDVTNVANPNTNPANPAGATADGVQISNNVVGTLGIGNLGQGIELLIHNPAGSTSTANNVQINGNSIQSSKFNGVNLDLQYVQMNNLSLFNNTAISSNGGNGVRANLLGTTWTNLTTGGNTIAGNTGVNVATSGNGIDLVLNKSTLTGWNDGALGTATGDTITGNAANGLLISYLNTSSVTAASFYGVAINKNGTDGVQVANDGTKVTFGGQVAGTGILFNGGSISDNGQAVAGNGVNLNTLLSGSVANLAFVNETINNTAVGGKQQNGLVYTIGANPASTGGTVNAIFTDGTISNNTLDAINGTIFGTGAIGGSQSTVSLSGTAVNNSGQTGTLFTLKNDATLNLTVKDDGTTGSTITGSGQTAASGGAGTLINLDTASQLTFALTNSTISQSSGDGVQINASGLNTIVSATVLNSPIMNNGVAPTATSVGNGITLNLLNNAAGLATAQAAGPTPIDIALTVNNSTIGNSALVGGTQQDAVKVNVTGTQFLPNASYAILNNSILANNQVSALEGNVTGPNAGANLTTGLFVQFNQVAANSNGGNGVVFNVSSGGLASFAQNNSSTFVPAAGVTLLNTTSTISGNVLDGVFVKATGANTDVAMLFQDSAINGNGTATTIGDGVNVTATLGAHINIGAETTGIAPMTFSGNTGSGLDVFGTGTGTRIDVDLHNTIVGSNGNPAGSALLGNSLNGLMFQSNDGATVLVRAYDTKFDGNGIDGMTGSVNDTNNVATNGIVRIIGGEASWNGGNGYSLTGTNSSAVITPGVEATVTGQFQADDAGIGIVATNNGGFGLNFVASGTGGIVGNLLMTGGSTLTNNGPGGNLNVNMNGADSAIIGLSGTFDGSQGDGIKIDLQNITGLALVSLQGPGEVMNNAGDGINIIMNNVKQGGVFIGGFNNPANPLPNGIMNNGTANGAGGLGQDGIQVTMTNVATGALTINGTNNGLANTNVSGNSGNGVNVLINGGTVINNPAFTAALGNVNVIKYPETGFLTDQLITTVHPSFPPVPDPLLTIVSIPASSALNFTFAPSLAIENLNVDSNGNATAGNRAGDGILLTLGGLTPPDSATIFGIPTINGNTITNTGTAAGSTTGANAHDGIQVNLLNSVSLQKTAPTNLAELDIVNNYVGVTSVNTASLLGGNNGNGINVIENDTAIATPGFSSLQTLTVSGNFIHNNTGGAGVSGSGIVLQLPSALALANVNILNDQIVNNKGDGVQMLNPNVNTVPLTNMTVTFEDNTITGNGTLPALLGNTTYAPGSMGIDILLSNTTKTRSTTIDIYSNAAGQNIVNNNLSYGLLLQTTNQAIYNLNVTNVPGGPTTDLQNQFNGNRDAGIALVAGSTPSDPTLISVGYVVIDNVQAEGNLIGNHPNQNIIFQGDGIGVLTKQSAEIAKFVIGNVSVVNSKTALTGNNGDGLRIAATDNSQFAAITPYGIATASPLGQATILLQNVNASGNGTGGAGGNGVEILSQGNSLLSWDDAAVNLPFGTVGTPGYSPGATLADVTNPQSWQYITDPTNGQPGGSFIKLNDVVANGATGGGVATQLNGLLVNATNRQYPITRIDIADPAQNGGSQFNNNVQNGMDFVLKADTITVVHALDTVANGNANDGILVQTFSSASFGDVQTSQPLGDPTSPFAEPSTFNGMTVNNNTAQGIEVIANNEPPAQTDSPSLNSIVALSMSSGTLTAANPTGRNLFDSNGGDSFKFTANRFSTNYVSLNNVVMTDTQNNSAGGDGIHFTTTDKSTTTLYVTGSKIGQQGNVADSSTHGLSGNGIQITTYDNSAMTMLLGNQGGLVLSQQTIPGVTWAAQSVTPGTNGSPQAIPGPSGSPDVTFYGNQGAGILIQNTGASRFFGSTYDTSAQYNGNRGYSALISQASLSVNQINYSSFINNTQEGIAIVANAENQSGTSVLVADLNSSFNTPPIYDQYQYLNFASLTNASLVLTNSVVSNNGVASPYVSNPTQPVNGVEIDVSTFANVTADIRGNQMKGNTLADFATGSFVATAGNAAAGVPVGFNGFNANGTVNAANRIDTPASIFHFLPNTDRMFLDDTAQLDLRFIGNVGNKLALSSTGSDNQSFNNVSGAVGTDPSGSKYNEGGTTGLFQVDAFHYDVVNTVTSANVFTGTNILPLDGFPTGTVFDSNNYQGANGGIRGLQAGIVNIDGFYTNANANPNNALQTAFTQVRVDNITKGLTGAGTGTPSGTLDTTFSNGVVNYVGATGQFTLANAGMAMNAGDTFRIHLLDTNSFEVSSSTQVDVQNAFSIGFQQIGDVGGGQGGLISGGSPVVRDPNISFFNNYMPNPLAPYFDFPSVSFPAQ